ncbi:probable disease resistance protein At4g27220 [Fagus crenata]
MHAAKIEDKLSLYKVVEEILGLLKDRDVKRIGLWGSGGIGKTTIMRNLNNHEDIAKMFDIVIWITISKDRSEEKLQHAITDWLKMNMEVWNILDLPKLGIQDNQKDSKVVLVTRFPKICCDMKTELINMKQMFGADAWKMFTEKVGQNVNLPFIEPIAKLVVREAKGFICDANKFSDARGEGHKILQFRDACDEGHKMLLDLINVSLLEESEKMNHCLRALYLNSCISLMELHYLEELELELKCLRMSLSNFGKGQSRDVKIHPNVFSNLYLLELRIDVDPNNREWEALVEVIIEEVVILKCLTSLSICFPKVDCLKSFISKSPLWKDENIMLIFSI